MRELSLSRNCFAALLVVATLFGCNGSPDAMTDLDNGPRPVIGSGEPNPALLGRSFQYGGKTRVPADFQEMDLSLDFDVNAGVATGNARIRFRATEDGYPVFLMTPSITSAALNGREIAIEAISDPDRVTSLRSIDQAMKKGEERILELEYRMPASEVSFRSTGVGFISSMADIDSGNFFEAYGPANIEADQYKMNMQVSLTGAVNSHRIFANGEVTEVGTNAWRIDYPAYFNTSAFYLHVTDTQLYVRETVYRGLEKDIPVTIYSQSSASTESAFSQVQGLFRELEATYGPYLHDSFIAYISGSGGMEHAGATITSVSALGHELTHSWFARGVMPADGRAGWIDEAVASWRDNGYVRSGSLLNRTPTNLSLFSSYQLFTPYRAYAAGRALMSDLDHVFSTSAGTSLRPVLKSFFSVWKGHVVSTEIFRAFLESETQASLGGLFDRYVYGNYAQGGQTEEDVSSGDEADRGAHPPALTQDEVIQLR